MRTLEQLEEAFTEKKFKEIRKAIFKEKRTYKGWRQRYLEKLESSVEFREWYKLVLVKDDFLCQRCFGYEKEDEKVAHRLVDPFSNIDIVFHIDNGACLCKKCEQDYIQQYGIAKTSKKQFEAFVKDYYE